MIIANYIEKIKRVAQKTIYFLAQKDFLVSLVILFTGVSAFTLGLLEGREEAKTAPKINFSENPRLSQSANTLSALDKEAKDLATSTKATIFGSKNGTKYYFSWCNGANRVKLVNRIYFASEEQAKKAGRTLASGCK